VCASDLMDSIAASVNQIESIRAQLDALEKELGTDDTGKAIRKAADDLAEKLTTVEGKVLQLKATGRGQDDVRWSPMVVQKIGYLAEHAGSSDFAPTTQQVAVGEELKKQGDQFQQEYQQILTKDVAAFNAMLREKNIPNIIVKLPLGMLFRVFKTNREGQQRANCSQMHISICGSGHVHRK